MNTRNRSEHSANLALSPDTFRASLSPETLQALRNMSALCFLHFPFNWSASNEHP